MSNFRYFELFKGVPLQKGVRLQSEPPQIFSKLAKYDLTCIKKSTGLNQVDEISFFRGGSLRIIMLQ